MFVQTGNPARIHYRRSNRFADNGWPGDPGSLTTEVRRIRKQSGGLFSQRRIPDLPDVESAECMALRQMTGFVESLLRLIDLDWPVPNFSTLSRRQRTLKVNIPYRGSQGPLHLLIDIEPVSATGLERTGEGHQGRG